MMSAPPLSNTVSPSNLRTWLSGKRDVTLIDVREEDTFAEGHLLRACSLPLSRLELLAPNLLPRVSMEIVVYANTDALAHRAAKRLHAAGYQNVTTLEGGLSAWQSAGFPIYKGVHVPSKGFAEIIEHNAGTPFLQASDIARLRSARKDFVILDSRSHEEYRDNTIPSAINVPGAELVYRIRDIAPSEDTIIVVNCGGRTRSIIGAQSLINAGVANKIYSLKDGTMGWHLAGLELERGQHSTFREPSPAALDFARKAASAVASRFNLKAITYAELITFRANADRQTLYMFDVRSPDEYQSGHLDGFVNVPGGQLIQETDRWVASWQAHIVLADETCTRSIMTASWLSQLGYANVFYLKDAVDPPSLTQAQSTADQHDISFPLEGPDPHAMTVEAAEAKMRAGGCLVVDVGLSSNFGAGHLTGAWHAVRSRLIDNLQKLPEHNFLLVTSEDGMLARFAASELILAGEQCAFLLGGTTRWAEAGRDLEIGLSRCLDEPDDVYYVPRKRKKDQARYMKEYLDWEQGLLHQLSSDPDCPFPVHT